MKAMNEGDVEPRVTEVSRFTGPLWLLTGTTEAVTGARSSESMISGTTGDIDDNT